MAIYSVVEGAGTDDQTTVLESNSYADCTAFLQQYSNYEIETMKVDILKDGSTEF